VLLVLFDKRTPTEMPTAARMRRITIEVMTYTGYTFITAFNEKPIKKNAYNNFGTSCPFALLLKGTLLA
jgi:hypothetical protein